VYFVAVFLRFELAVRFDNLHLRWRSRTILVRGRPVRAGSSVAA
jgi:hypothetical protein